MIVRVLTGCALCLLFVLCWPCAAHAAYFNRQTYYGTGGGGPIGDGSLSMSNNAATVYAGFNKGTGSFSDNLVMFIDCAPGGFTTTSGFTNKNNALETAISGYKTSRSVANFAPGFEADYAIVVGINSGSGIYKLVNDGSGPNLQLVQSINLMPAGSPNYPQYYWQFDWAALGLSNGNTNFFKFETTLVTATGSRALQSFEGITGTGGFGTINFTNYDTYGVQPIPENAAGGLALFSGIAATIVLVRRLRPRR
ncbi:MAG TPA: hypothetical protein VFE51_29180 [Verrucomicrobiae bacterium]|nr:hypothetical protein [Verrucomicrobiae bacterium]